jgi:pantoate--beta-alanine ligase
MDPLQAEPLPAAKLFRTARRDEATRRVLDARRRGQSVGVVMTMGALHAGHVSLVRESVRQCDWTAVTIFVNPTQFAPNEDLAKYPRDLEGDLGLLSETGADLVFTPEVADVYRPGHSTYIEPPLVSQPWEGQCRPGHFRGVTTVVLKLLHILPCDVAYFGQKDYQQYCVLRAMVQELDLPVDVRMCPIVRDPDGMAMSSRNRYLTAEQRQRGLAISESLRIAEQAIAEGETRASALAARIRAHLTAGGITKIDYVAIADADDLSEIREVRDRTVIAIAAYVDEVRLIDNLLVLTS